MPLYPALSGRVLLARPLKAPGCIGCAPGQDITRHYPDCIGCAPGQTVKRHYSHGVYAVSSKAQRLVWIERDGVWKEAWEGMKAEGE